MTFGKIFNRETDDLVESYYQILKKYTDKQVTKSAYVCMEELKWLPRPNDIKKNILPETPPQEFLILNGVRCKECGKIATCIREPAESDGLECRQCYTGLTTDQIAERFKDLGRIMADKNYLPDWVKRREEVPF